MEHTNGNYLSGDGAQVIYLDEEDKIKAQIEEADKMADVVVVSCHYGTEIQNELNEQQTEITPKLVEWVLTDNRHAGAHYQHLRIS